MPNEMGLAHVPQAVCRNPLFHSHSLSFSFSFSTIYVHFCMCYKMVCLVYARYAIITMGFQRINTHIHKRTCLVSIESSITIPLCRSTNNHAVFVLIKKNSAKSNVKLSFSEEHSEMVLVFRRRTKFTTE